MEFCYDNATNRAQNCPSGQADFENLPHSNPSCSAENASRALAQRGGCATDTTPNATPSGATTPRATRSPGATQMPRTRIGRATFLTRALSVSDTAARSVKTVSTDTLVPNRAKASRNIASSCINKPASRDPSAKLRATPSSNASSACPNPGALSAAGIGSGNIVSSTFMVCS